MLVLLSLPRQGEGEEDRRSSSSSDSDSEEVTTPPAPCWDLAVTLHPSPVGVAPTEPCVDAGYGGIKYLEAPGDGTPRTQHSPHMLFLFFLFLPQGGGSDKNDEKEDKD